MLFSREILMDDQDFEIYKTKVDGRATHIHGVSHEGTPREYPCIVTTAFAIQIDGNKANHRFVYVSDAYALLRQNGATPQHSLIF